MVREVLKLDSAATELYADPRLGPLLRQLLTMSSALVGAAASSVSLVDPTQDTYIKMAEHGASCQLGRSFPLNEGVTGQVFARRRPVLLDSYSDVPHGHLPGSHPARRGAVVAVPIWWRGDVIGATVLFSGGPHRFLADEIDEVEMLAQLAAAGIVRAGAGDPSLTNLTRKQSTAGPELTDLTAVAAPPMTTRSAAAGRVDPRRASLSPALGMDSGPAINTPPFTPREQDVLRLLAIGITDKEVAQALVISTKTVEKHVGALLRKTGATSRTAAVMRALDRGWLPREATRLPA